MIDPFSTFSPGLDTPCVSNAFEITPSDTADLPAVTRYLWVSAYGYVKVTMASGEIVTLRFNDNTKGGLLPFRVRKVHATGTELEKSFGGPLIGLY
jgi:hypothetical protein